MKTRFFSFVAALLLSVCAFAQSGNIDPARGDVNGDGVVDVADVTAVISIMKNGGGTVQVSGYFYLGIIQPTAENYQTLPGVVSTYTSIDAADGASASVSAGETVYMLCPAAWVKEKSVELEDKDGNAIDFLEEKDATTISGYVIYKTQALNDPNNVVLKTSAAQQTPTYYWYVGQSNPDSLTTIDPIVTDTSSPGWRLTGNSLTSTYNYDSTSNPIVSNPSQNAPWYFALPENTGLGVFDAQNTNYATGTPVSNVIINGIKYNIWNTGASRKFGAYTIKNIVQTKTYYWYVGQSNPAEMTTISPIVTDTTSPGWRLIGTTLPTYNSSNKLYDATDPNSLIITGTSLATQWVAIPNESSACVRDGASNDGSTVNICTRKSNITLGGIEYKVYEWNGKAKKLGYDIY